MSHGQQRRNFSFGKMPICQTVSNLPQRAWQLGKLYIGVWGICQAYRKEKMAHRRVAGPATELLAIGGNMGKFLGAIDKSGRERIEIRAAEYEGHPYIDIRTFWRSDDAGEWRPSKKGVTLKPSLVEELISILGKVEG